MKFSLSPSLVKQSLSSHSWIGLLVGALMYLVCLSGSVVVFYHEFQRWEQPTVSEMNAIEPAGLQLALGTLFASGEEITEHLYVTLPKADMPRATVQTEKQGWFVNGDGSLGASVAHPWTEMLTDLHLYLHLPKSWGMILVSVLGVMLCSLVISGFLAHPRLFRDVFSLRLGGSRHLEQADIHNRLSVWGAPFHLMIGITGAYFGLAALLTLVLASAFFDGDRQQAMATIFGDEPALEEQVAVPRIAAALEDLAQRAPEVTPFMITIHDAGTPAQFIDVGARVDGRLIWAEWYQYDAAGNYLNRGGYTDGPVAKQAVYSIYRLHFGHFDGLWVKLGYLVLGLALTAVSATGINIWLARRKTRDAINNLWVGLLWSVPGALALSATVDVVAGVGLGAAGFWVPVILGMAASQWLDDEQRSRALLQALGGLLLLLLVLSYGLVFGSAALSPAALLINGLVLIAGVSLLYPAARHFRGQRAVTAPSAAG